jgi:hypothetical protein
MKELTICCFGPRGRENNNASCLLFDCGAPKSMTEESFKIQVDVTVVVQ